MLAAPLTELEAVNDMLIGIGQHPVNAFSSGITDQNIARAELAKVVRQVLLHGFKFNTDENYVLTPDIDNLIVTPAGAMRVDPMDPNCDLIQRKHPSGVFALWDAANHTWEISEPVKCRVTWSFGYDALPEAARGYCVIAAARKFQARVIGDINLDRFNQEDEHKAWLTLRREEADSADINMFTASPELAVKIGRRNRMAWFRH